MFNFVHAASADLTAIQHLVNNLFELYPAEDGLKPNITRTYNEFMRFP